MGFISHGDTETRRADAGFVSLPFQVPGGPLEFGHYFGLGGGLEAGFGGIKTQICPLE